MCLAKIFVNNWKGLPVFENITHLQVFKDRVELETIFGEEKIVAGRITEIDFTTSEILLEKSPIIVRKSKNVIDK